MSIIIKEVYDAFLDAGASEQKATAAAKAVAGCNRHYGLWFDRIGRRLNKIDNKLDKIEFDLLTLKWMTGLILAVDVLSVLKVCF